MVLLDAIYINNSGGKILLDYLIETLENSNLEIHYLLDERVRGKHPVVKNKVTYLVASFVKRHQFYTQNKKTFSKVLCFGNLPPSIKISASVYTYFHQKLFLEIPKGTPFKNKMIFLIKSFVFTALQNYTDFWIVQTEVMAKLTREKMRKPVLVIPFYPSLQKTKNIVREKNTFVYVSSGIPHKNHPVLVDGFCKFYDEKKTGELHLTISSEFKELYGQVETLISQGYPIINHGFVPRPLLSEIYSKSTFSIYPSLSESFGLGNIEALEQGCLVIGADLPYTYAVCEPSLVFDPTSVESITNCFNFAYENKYKDTKQIVFNEIEKIIELLK